MMEDRPPADAPRPEGYGTVAPWLISDSTAAEIDFLQEVFAATEKPGSRITDGDRITHVEVDLAGSVVLLFDGFPSWVTPGHLRVYVNDVEATLKRAQSHGAELVTAPTDMAWGERIARFRDPQGHLWWIHQHTEDVSQADMMARFADPAFADGAAYVGQSLIDHMDGNPAGR